MATYVIDAAKTMCPRAIDILNARLVGVQAQLDALGDGDGRERLEGHRAVIEQEILEIQRVKNSPAEMRKEPPDPYPGAGTIWDEDDSSLDQDAIK